VQTNNGRLPMTEQQFLKRLARFITEERDGVSAYARHMGVSRSFISEVKNGRKPATAEIMADIGFERVKKTTISYVKSGG
jgi:plasmid maintenance system antidote protein VapI